MKKYWISCISAGLLLTVFVVTAQKPVAKKKVSYKGATYFEGGQVGSGTLSKDSFDVLLDSKLVSKDSSGVWQPVLQFQFTYIERGLYEDSTGKPTIMTDKYSIGSDQGKVPEDWVGYIRQRSKAGDTVIYDQIISRFPDSAAGKPFYSLPMKLILTD